MNSENRPGSLKEDRLAALTADLLIARERRSGEEAKPRRRIILVLGTFLILGSIAYGLIWDRIHQHKAALRNRPAPAAMK